MQKIRFTLLFLVYSFAAMAQYSFNGRVLDELQQPISGVTIVLGKNEKLAITDSLGNYSFKNALPVLSLSFSHVGFYNKEVNVDSTLPAIIVLLRNSELLQETIVRAFEHKNNLDVAAAITVLNKSLLNRFSTQSFVAAVNTVPGVKMDERSPGSYRLSIRGNLLRSTFGVRNVKVYWNGMPFTDANGNTYINQLSLNCINGMEIIRGPSGSMYGSGTGGVVLMSTANTVDTKQQLLDVQVSGGSYGLFSANASYEKTGNNYSNLTLSHLQSDGYRNHTNMRKDVFHYTGNYEAGKRHRIGLNVLYSDLFYQTPGALNLAELNANPAQARPAAGAFQGAATQQAAIYLKTFYTSLSDEIIINKNWTNTTGLYFSYTDFTNPTIRNYEDKYEKGAGGRTVFQFKKSFFTGTFGGEYQQGFFNTGVYGNKEGIKDTLQFIATIQSKLLNAFAQTDFKLPADFLISAGISFNNFNYSYIKKSDINALKESSNFEPQFIPRLSLLKKIKAISIYATVGSGYSVPTIDEVHAGNDEFNSALKAETAINYELGIKGDIIKNKLSIDAAYYLFSLQNTIVSRRDSSGGDYYTNAGKTKQNGAEIAIYYLPVNNSHLFFRTIKLSATYTSIIARFENYQQGLIKYDGNKLTGTPPNTFVLNADIFTSKGFYSNISYSYTDHIPLNDANSIYAPSYQLFFAKLGYKTTLGRNIETQFFAAYETCFNNPYSLGNDLNAAGNRYFNATAPQTFTAGIQCRFKVK